MYVYIETRETDMARVYVTQEIPRINYASALDYGEVVFLSTEEYKPEPTRGDHNIHIKTRLTKEFSDYVPGEDYVLTSGSPISILMAGMLMSPAAGPHKVLKWNNQSNRYDTCNV